MDQDLYVAFRYIRWAAFVGVALFFVKVALSILLKSRHAPGLAPSLHDSQPNAFLARAVALIGINARSRVTLGTVSLRSTLGLKLAYVGGIAVYLSFLWHMQSPLISIESALGLLLLLATLQNFLLEIVYDRESITLPRWWFGRTTHKWKDLLALRTNDPWFLVFSFDKGPVVRVNKYIVGYAQLVDTARKAMRES